MICEVRLELEAERVGLEGVRRGGGRSRGGERDRELISGAMGLSGGQGAEEEMYKDMDVWSGAGTSEVW